MVDEILFHLVRSIVSVICTHWWDVHGSRVSVSPRKKLPEFKKNAVSQHFFPRKWWSKNKEPIPINQQWLQSISQSHLHVFFVGFSEMYDFSTRYLVKKKSMTTRFFRHKSSNQLHALAFLWADLRGIAGSLRCNDGMCWHILTDMKAYCCTWNPCHTFSVCVRNFAFAFVLKGLPLFWKMTP